MNDIDEEWKDTHEIMVTMPFSTYEYMLDCMTRLDILATFYRYKKEVSEDEILLIMDIYKERKRIEAERKVEEPLGYTE